METKKYYTNEGLIDFNSKTITGFNGKSISFNEMDEIIKKTKSANRIYKPFIQLYYTDLKNGKGIDKDLLLKGKDLKKVKEAIG